MSGLTKNSNVNIGKLPEQTSKWDSESDLVYKLFKARTCIFDVDTILWPGNQAGYSLDNCFAKSAMAAPCDDYFISIFSFLDKAFHCLDIEDDDLADGIARSKATDLRNQIVQDVIRLKLKHAHDNEVNTAGSDHKIMMREYWRLEQSIRSFLVVLESVLSLNYNDACAKAFEELLRSFIQIIGLYAISGETYNAKFQFTYTDENDASVEKTVSSNPDLFVYNPGKQTRHKQQSALAIVEVKKHVQQRKRDTEVGLGCAAKRRKVEEDTTPREDPQMNDCVEQADSCAADNDDCSLMQKDYKNGTLRCLTTQEEQMIGVFLPQLLGEVAAADSSPLLDLQRIPLRDLKKSHIAEKSVIGFGVVGFKVYVVNFICVKRDKGRSRLDFHLIPCIPGLGLDILISEPVSILRRNDRNKLFKLLYALQTSDNLMRPQ